MLSLRAVYVLSSLQLRDAYRFGFSSLACLAIHIAPCFLFQPVQSQPARLILNGCIEFFGIIGALKCPESPTTSWLRDRHLMKFFAFDRYRTQAGGVLCAAYERRIKALVALLSIPLILAHPLG
jgi:hypothetical protein